MHNYSLMKLLKLDGGAYPGTFSSFEKRLTVRQRNG